MNKIFLILVTILFSIFLVNNVFALTTIVDVNIQHVNVPTWQNTCEPTQRSTQPYINGQNQYLELTYSQGGNNIYVSGEQLSYITANKTTQKVATFAFERDPTKVYDLKISILPIRHKTYINHNNYLTNPTASINCVLTQTPGTRDHLSVTGCRDDSTGWGTFWGCTLAQVYPLMTSRYISRLEIQRNCITPKTESDEYAYPQLTYSYQDWNATSGSYYQANELDSLYPNRYCIELGTIS